MADDDEGASAPKTLPLHINIDPAGLRAALMHQLTLNYQRAAVALNLAEQATHEHVVIEDVAFRLTWAVSDRPTDELMREDFGRWVLTSSLRDAVESVGYFLDEADRVFAYIDVSQRPLITPDELAAVDKRHESFRGEPLGGKLKTLEDTYAVVLPTALRERITSLQRARNCLVHRGGRVGSRDVGQDGRMTVRWQRMRLVIANAAGEERELVGAVTEVGDSPVLKIEPVSRDFVKGELMIFAKGEYAEILFTLTRVVEPVMLRLVERLKEIGQVDEAGNVIRKGLARGRTRLTRASVRLHVDSLEWHHTRHQSAGTTGNGKGRARTRRDETDRAILPGPSVSGCLRQHA